MSALQSLATSLAAWVRRRLGHPDAFADLDAYENSVAPVDH